MYRLLVRLLLSNPVVLFGTLAAVVVIVSVVAFVMSERRARRMAALAEDDEIASSQRKRLVAVVLVAAGGLSLSAWWVFFRVHTEPDRVLVAVRIEDGPDDTDNQWWHGHPAAFAVASHLEVALGDLGLEVVEPAPEGKRGLAWAQSSPQALIAAARREQARWVIDGRISVQKEIVLPRSDRVDYVMRVEVAVIDAVSGERLEVPHTPFRAFLWGRDVDDAVVVNGEYVASRLTSPTVATIAGQPALDPYREGPDRERTIDENLRADRLAGLFRRQRDQADAIELRARHASEAEKAEPADAGGARRTRIGDVLAEEFVIGTASDGRLVVHADPKHISASPDRAGYVITNEGENFSLVSPDGAQREVLFEHYNIYGVSDVSADGLWIWVVLANHGASKTLGAISTQTGELISVLTHPTEYFALPTPSPDGSRATYLSRPDRYGSSSLLVVNRDDGERVALAKADEAPGTTAWSRDGERIYAVLHAPSPRIVVFDATTGERTHLLGETPEARAARLEHAAAVLAARAALADLDAGLRSAEDTDEAGLRALVEEAEAAEQALASAPDDDADAAAGKDDDVDADADELAALLDDPASRSAFVDVAVNHDGSALFVTEVTQQADGSDVSVVGRFDLASANYVRLEPTEAERLVPSPVDDRVAVTSDRRAASPSDPTRNDREILIIGPGADDELLVTNNGVDDEVTAWSRDGKAVFSFQRGADPGSARTPVARIYRHDLP